MAPVKFGLFKARSRDHQEQPSTENLLHNSNSSDHVTTPGSPMPSTSKGIVDFSTPPAPVYKSVLLDSDVEDEEDAASEKPTPTRISECSRLEEEQMNYRVLHNQTSTDATSTSTLHTEYYDKIQPYEDPGHSTIEDYDGASTSCDANSLQFDEMSITPSEDLSVYCANIKKPKKYRSNKEERQMRDLGMWQASNVEVMQNLLNRSGTVDEQIKWEAIATARGLCTLTDSCTCPDCTRAKYLAGVTDGDGGLGAAPLINAISVGCQIQ